MPAFPSGPSDPKVFMTIDRATAEEWAESKRQFCERCGAAPALELFDYGFWGTTGQKRCFYGLVCSTWLADPKKGKKGHFGVVMLENANPDTEDQSGAIDYGLFSND